MLALVHNLSSQPPSHWCGSPELFQRAYLLPPHFPYPPIRLVMEREPGKCDLYLPEKRFCRSMEHGNTFEPEYHVREAIASFLDGCHRRRCAAVDLGANNGWFTAVPQPMSTPRVCTLVHHALQLHTVITPWCATQSNGRLHLPPMLRD